MKSIHTILIIILILINCCANGDLNQMTQVENKVSRLIKDLSNTGRKLPYIYDKHFRTNEEQKELALVILLDMRNTMSSVDLEKVVLIKPVDEQSSAVINAAREISVTAVYKAVLGNREEGFFFGVRETGELVIFTPLNQGKKGVIII
jgi:hypothetical protein